jgi:very-short-patch-repair endonuclease
VTEHLQFEVISVSFSRVHDTDIAVFELASAQAGTFARWQLGDTGVDDKLIERRCTSGVWLRVRPGVFVLRGTPPSRATDLWCAWLSVGPHAVRSHECAAEARGLHPVLTGQLIFTTRHGDHHRQRGVTVHQLGDLLPHHVAAVDGIPTTTAARTVVDLASVVGLERLKQIVENASLEKVTTDDEVGVVLHQIARPGKRGIRKLVRVLAMRAPGEPVPDSALERMLLDALRSVGLPDPIPQFPHPGREIGTGWVDFAYPEAKLILEADGRRWHQRITQMAFDVARDKAAARMGWLTMRFLHEELRADPRHEAMSVVETLAHRTAA